MRDVRVVFLYSGEFDSTVFDSQVVDSIVASGELGIAVDLVVLMHGSPYLRRRAHNRQRREEIASRIPGDLRVYPTLRKETFAGDLGAALVLLGDLLRTPARRTVIHARGDGAAYFASLCKRVVPGARLVYDVRGDSIAEHSHYARQAGLRVGLLDRKIRQLDRERRGALQAADAIFCVSSALRDRLLARYGGSEGRFTVIPCVADTGKFFVDENERRTTREALGLERRFVMVYPGRFGRWHYGPEMIGIVRAVLATNEDAFFLVLTPDVEEARALASATLPVGSFEIRAARHEEIPRYLRAADLGLLLRERDPVNEVACPTKFAEYLLCGLPVLISPGIGDCTDFIASHAAGAVLDAVEPALAAELVAALRPRLGPAQRASIAAAGLELYSRKNAAIRIAETYGTLAGG